MLCLRLQCICVTGDVEVTTYPVFVAAVFPVAIFYIVGGRGNRFILDKRAAPLSGYAKLVFVTS